MSTDQEQWRDAPGYPGYQVSDRGRVRSLDRAIERRSRQGQPYAYRLKGRVLELLNGPGGYVLVNLGAGGRSKRVHILVALAFHGPQPGPGHEVAHGDGNRRNNGSRNLRWATKLENAADRDRHGTTARGERSGLAKLTEAHVRQIRSRHAGGVVQREVAKQFGVSQVLVSLICRRKSWAHVV